MSHRKEAPQTKDERAANTIGFGSPVAGLGSGIANISKYDVFARIRRIST
jgi:hypothetical protein